MAFQPFTSSIGQWERAVLEDDENESEWTGWLGIDFTVKILYEKLMYFDNLYANESKYKNFLKKNSLSLQAYAQSFACKFFTYGIWQWESPVFTKTPRMNLKQLFPGINICQHYVNQMNL